MPQRGRGLLWASVPGQTAETMEALKVQLRKFNDAGENPLCEWHRVPGGNRGEREIFRCGAHEDCMVRIRLVKKGDALYIEKLADMKHSEVKAEFDRINAKLTKEQKAAFKLRKQVGATASDIMKHDQQEAVTKGNKRTEGEDETGVEGVQSERTQTHSCSRFSRADGRLSAVRRIVTHVHAFMHISTHAYAC